MRLRLKGLGQLALVACAGAIMAYSQTPTPPRDTTARAHADFKGTADDPLTQPGAEVQDFSFSPSGTDAAMCTSSGACPLGNCKAIDAGLLDGVKLGRSEATPAPPTPPATPAPSPPQPLPTSEPITGGTTPVAQPPTTTPGSNPPSSPIVTAAAPAPAPVIPTPSEPGRVIRETTYARDRAALSGKVPAQPSMIPENQFDQLRESLYVADNARGMEFVESALDRKRQVESIAKTDSDTLTKAFDKVPLSEAPQTLERAKNYLRETAAKLETVQSGMFPGELARFRNLYLNAADKADAASSILQDHARTQVPETLKLPFNPFDLQNLGKAKTPEIRDLTELLGGATAGDALQRPSPTSEDALVNRMVMFGGLKDAARQETQQALGLVYVPELKLAGGKTEEIPILHNGYILGASSKTAFDCSSFVSEMLSPRSRGMRLTTLDFLQMWRFQKTGQFVKPPRYERDREEQVRTLSRSFIPIDIYKGERLASGDFLVYRQPSEPIGHVVLVKKYDPKLDKVTMIDAAQSAGTIRERELQMSKRDGQGRRMVRSGFIALRMKANDNTACKYKR
jgi:hypothetical protein